MVESIYFERNCDFCETPFKPISPRQKYCRYNCRANASNDRKKASRPLLWKTKNCTICEKEFQAGSPIAKYCSSRCRNLATQRHRDQLNGIEERKQLFRETTHCCHFCSKEFHPKNITHKYCNESCKMEHRRVKAREARLRYEPIACLVCRCKFKPKNYKNVYCSSECGTVANKRRQLKKRTVLCPQCSKIFTTFGSNQNTKIYCSAHCKKLAQHARIANSSEEKVRKKEELFAKGIKKMVVPIAKNFNAVAITRRLDCKVTKKHELDGPSDFTKEIEKFLSKGGEIKKLEATLNKNQLLKVFREELAGHGIDDSDYLENPSELPII